MSSSPSTRENVLRLTRSGLTARQIARALDLSTQAIHYHLKQLRRAGELPPRKGKAA